MRIEVLEPGLATTVQDLGRRGYYKVGIPPSGALDQFSCHVANWLVGNPAGAAVLEATYAGPRLRFQVPAVVAVAGAEMRPVLNDEPSPLWESFEVTDGDVLSFQYLAAGARAYIAVSGGFDVPEVLGSRSTYALGAIGGVKGRPLQVGDVLPLGSSSRTRRSRSLPAALRPRYERETEIRVVMGLYDHLLTPDSKGEFLEAPWTLTPVADRIGLRYAGPRLEFTAREQPFGAGSDPSNIVDAGYPIGSIQVPGGAESIVLHRDAVSGGGYAMIGTVISGDLDLVGQSAPNTLTRFVGVDLDQALDARAVYKAHLAAAKEALG